MSCKRIGVACAALALAAPGRAHAGREVQATVAASGGYTDNAGAAAADLAVASPFFHVQPGLSVLWGSLRTIERVSYTFNATAFSDDGARQFNAYSNQASYALAHAVDARTDLLLEIALTHQQTNTATLDAAAGTGGAVAAPGTLTFLGAGLTQGLSHDFSPVWRGVQGFSLSYFRPIDQPGGGTAGSSLASGLVFAGERAYSFDALGVELATGVNWIDQGTTSQTIVLNRGLARWTHLIAPSWKSELEAGGLFAIAPDTGDTQLEPIGGATLAYETESGSAGLFAGRTATLNPFVGQTLLTDSVGVRAGLPLVKDTVLLGATASYAHSQTLIDDPMLPSFTVNFGFVDAGIGWRVRPNLDLGVRYQRVEQWSADQLGAPPDLTRNVFLVTLDARYPDETRTKFPFRKPLRMERNPEDDDLGRDRLIRR
jgi:hypothetical protein